MASDALARLEAAASFSVASRSPVAPFGIDALRTLGLHGAEDHGAGQGRAAILTTARPSHPAPSRPRVAIPT